MKIFNEILDKHTKMYNCKRESYMINDDLEILISQDGNKVAMWGVNHKTDRFLNLSTKKFKKLMDGFKSVSTDMYSNGNCYYITLGTSNNDSLVEDESYEVEIEELKSKIDCLNDVIARLERNNKRLEDDVEKLSLYKMIDKYGEVCCFEYQKPIQIIQRLKEICNLYKVNVDNYTLQYLIECCGTNMQDLINEIRKLIEYAGENGTIRKNDIDILCIKKLESVIFDLTDSLGKRNIANALEVLKNLLYAKEPLQKILVTLYNHFKRLYITSAAIYFNRDLIESLQLKPNQTFLVNKYKTQARYFKPKELRCILQDLCDLDYKYKNGLIDLQIGLETILCKYCGNN